MSLWVAQAQKQVRILFLMSLSSDKYFLVGRSGTQVSPEAGGYSRTRSVTKEDRSGKLTGKQTKYQSCGFCGSELQ